MNRSRKLNNQLTSLTMALLVMGLIAAQRFSLKLIQENRLPLSNEILTPKRFDMDFKPEFFTWITAGYWPAASDWLWVQGLYRIGGGKELSEYESDQLEIFMRLAVTLDPHYLNWYLDPGVHFSFAGNRPDVATEFLEKGFQNFQNQILPELKSNQLEHYDYGDWARMPVLAIQRAYTYGFVKRDWKKARDAFIEAEKIPNRPTYLSNFSKWLEEEGSEKRLGVKILNTLLRITKEPEKIKMYQAELENLLGANP